MTTQNSAMGDEELHTKLDDMLSNFLHDYRQGYDNSKEQGLNLEYCTFDSTVSFLDGIKELIKSRDQQIALAARKESSQVLQGQIAKYGDGTIVYHNGEAVVPISKVLAELSGTEQAQNKEK